MGHEILTDLARTCYKPLDNSSAHHLAQSPDHSMATDSTDIE